MHEGITSFQNVTYLFNSLFRNIWIDSEWVFDSIHCMKKCNKCQVQKTIECFPKNRAKADGFSGTCLECAKERNRLWYQKNKTYQRSKVDERRADFRKKFAEFKAGFVCEVCKEKEVCCLEFHHDDPSQKEFDLGAIGIHGCSWEKILAEAAKCRVLCSNCHKKHHAGLITLPNGVAVALDSLKV